MQSKKRCRSQSLAATNQRRQTDVTSCLWHGTMPKCPRDATDDRIALVHVRSTVIICNIHGLKPIRSNIESRNIFMAVPGFQDLMLPFLQICKDGQERTVSQIGEIIAQKLLLSEGLAKLHKPAKLTTA